MALLSQAEIALLRRLPSEWTDADRLGLDTMRDPAWSELRRQGLAEERAWPPPDPRRGSYRHRGRAIDNAIRRRTQLRITARGRLRLRRLGRSRYAAG